MFYSTTHSKNIYLTFSFYPGCGMERTKDPLLLIRKRWSRSGGFLIFYLFGGFSGGGGIIVVVFVFVFVLFVLFWGWGFLWGGGELGGGMFDGWGFLLLFFVCLFVLLGLFCFLGFFLVFLEGVVVVVAFVAFVVVFVCFYLFLFFGVIWTLTILCQTPYNRKIKCVEGVVKYSSFLYSFLPITE